MADAAQGQVHLRQTVGCSFLFLTVDIDSPDIAALFPDKIGTLDKHTARAAAGVYQDVIFNTKPIAGKVYKNSENRRKQGVSCGFRCVCRYSICPIKPCPERG